MDLATIENFYKEISSIEISNENIDEKRELLGTKVASFIDSIESIEVKESLFEKNEELSKVLAQKLHEMKQITKQWHQKFQQLSELERFNTYLENYFIIIVYGKVNAGKSTLGNFFAKHRLEGQALEFFMYDKAGAEQVIEELHEIGEDKDGFATDTLEATAEIQGFRLDSLAWIDTPGLGSMTSINGELAQKYIEAADFIIFPTDSTDPFQRDDIEEVKKLFERSKKVTICITKSDTVGRKKDERGKYIRDANGKIKKFRINKSDNQRKVQEGYVNSELEKILGSNTENLVGDVISLSTLTASIGLKENDEALFINSNVPKLYEVLTDVVKYRAKALKKSNPYAKLMALIDNDLLGHSPHSIESIEQIVQSIEVHIDEALNAFSYMQKSIESDINAIVERVVSKYVAEIDKNNYQTYLTQIDQEVEESVVSLLSENIQKIMQNFMAKTDFVTASKTNDFSIEDKYETLTVRYKDSSLINKITFGLFGRSHSTVEETVHLGDNKDEVVLAFKNDRIRLHVENATQNYDVVINEFFGELRDYVEQMQEAIGMLKANLYSIKNDIEKEIAHV